MENRPIDNSDENKGNDLGQLLGGDSNPQGTAAELNMRETAPELEMGQKPQDRVVHMLPEAPKQDPSVTDALEAANRTKILVGQEKRLDRFDKAVKVNIENITEEMKTATERKTVAENLIVALDAQIEKAREEADGLSIKDFDLDVEVTKKESDLGAVDFDLQFLDSLIGREIEAIKEEKAEKNRKIDNDWRAKCAKIDETRSEDLKKMRNMLKEQTKDALAGESLLSDKRLAFEPSNLDNFKQVFGEDSEQMLRVKQTADGGEMAAAMTVKEIKKVVDELEIKKNEVKNVAAREIWELREDTEEKINEARKQGEIKRSNLLAEKERIEAELAVMNNKSQETLVALSKKNSEIRGLEKERKVTSKNIERQSVHIERLTETIETNKGWLAKVVEKIGEVSEKGASAVETLTQAELAVKNRKEDTLVEAELALIGIDTDAKESVDELNEVRAVEIKKENDTYESKKEALEDALISSYPDKLTRSPEGEVVTTGGLVSFMRGLGTVFSVYGLKFEVIASLHEAEIEIINGNIDDGIADYLEHSERQKSLIETQRDVALAEYNNALATTKALMETAVEIFGTGPVKPETAVQQKNFFTRAKSLLMGIFGKKKE